MAVCGYCGIELPVHHQDPGGREREYCTDSHRVMASRLRTAELAYENAEHEETAMIDPEPLVVEAYGVVTPPPDTPEDEDD